MTLFTGQRAFVVQRLSAIVILAYLAGATLWLLWEPGIALERWRAFSAQPLGAVLVLGLVGAVLAHAWVGVRDVLLDYARPRALRLTLLAAAALGIIGLAAWSALILAAHVASAS
jgi:succinate dehydrogenase / fumarate reductase membrane anchor subunit